MFYHKSLKKGISHFQLLTNMTNIMQTVLFKCLSEHLNELPVFPLTLPQTNYMKIFINNLCFQFLVKNIPKKLNPQANKDHFIINTTWFKYNSRNSVPFPRFLSQSVLSYIDILV